MTDEKTPSNGEKGELLEKLRSYGKEAKKDLFAPKSDFDERGLASGDVDLLEKSDAELFPDESEEYKPEERKPRIIINNSSKK